MAKNLIEAGIDQIIFSFDGGTKETYEKNRIGRFSKSIILKLFMKIFVIFMKLKKNYLLSSNGLKFK